MANATLKFDLSASGNLGEALDAATQKMKQLDNQVTRSTRGMNTYGQQTSRISGYFKFFKGAAQQAGYQIGDYAVQVANGTSKMQAFGQQGAQMLGIFGPIGALLGAGVAVFSAIAVAKQKATGAASDYKSSMDVLQTQISAVKEVTEILKMSQDDLNTTYGAGAEIVRGFAIEQAKLVQAQAARTLADQIVVANDAIKQFTQYSNTAFSSGQMYADALRNIKNELGVTGQGARDLESAFRDLRDAQSTEQQVAALQAIFDKLTQLGVPLDKVPTELNKALQEMIGLNREAAVLQTLMAQVAAESQNMNTGVSLARQGFTTQGLLPPPPKPKLDPSGAKKRDPLKDLMDRLKLETDLIGKTEAQRKVIQALGVDWRKYSDKAINDAVKIVEGINQQNDALKEMQKTTDSVASIMQTGLTNAFMSIFDHTKTAKEKFKDMARYMIAELYKVLVVQKLVGSFNSQTGQGTGIVNFLMNLGKRAQGGPVTAGRPYLVGERGPELIVPSRNATVLPNGSGAGGVTVNQNITFGSGVSRAEIQQMLPKIVETTKAAVFDAQRRSVSGMGY